MNKLSSSLPVFVFALLLSVSACGDEGGGKRSGGGGGGGGGEDPGAGGTGGSGGVGGSGGTGGTGGSGGSGGSGVETCALGAICEGVYNYAFITSDQKTGAMGGVVGADRRCQDLADAAGLPGTFVAWISDRDSNAIDRLGAASGWIRSDRMPFAKSRESLLAGELLYPLLDENQDGPQYFAAFTGTKPDGTWLDEDSDCGGWMSTADTVGMTGRTDAAGARWTQDGHHVCFAARSIFCLGTDHDRPLPDVPATGRRAFLSTGFLVPDQGIDAADLLCNDEAEGEGLPRNFKALLATSSSSPISRFDLSGDTWVRMDGLPLWEQAADATSGAFALPLWLRADGSSDVATVWLGSPGIDEAGSVEDSCDDWGAGTPATGRSVNSALATLSGANENFRGPCTLPFQLFCLEE